MITKNICQKIVLLTLLVSGQAIASNSAACIKDATNLEIWSEFKNRQLLQDDKLGRFNAVCSGSTLSVEVTNDQNKRFSESFNFPVNGVTNCKKYLEKFKGKFGPFLRNELVAFCTGNRCNSVKMEADCEITSIPQDFNRNDRDCETNCEAWAKTAHPNYLHEPSSIDRHIK